MQHQITQLSEYKHILILQLDSPDGWWLRSLHFQIIWLFLHLKFGENQGDGVPWICQNGPLTLATASQASSTSASARGVTTGEIKAGYEPTGAPQGTTTCVLRCQSPKRKAGRGGWGESRHTVSGLFQSHNSKFTLSRKNKSRHKTSVPVPSYGFKPEKGQFGSCTIFTWFNLKDFICFSQTSGYLVRY